MVWLILGLACAVFYTFEHIVSKRLVQGRDPYYVAHFQTLLIAVITLPIVVLLWGKLNISPKAIFGIIIAGSVMFVAQFLYMKAMKLGKLSKTIPLLTLTPLFTLPLAFFMLGELPSFLGVLGIIVIFLGTYALNFNKFSFRRLFGPFQALIKEDGSRFMLGVAIIYGLGSAINKYVIVHSSVWFQLFCWSYVTLVLQVLYLYSRDRSNYSNKLRDVAQGRFWGYILLVFVGYAVMTVQFIGLSLTYTAYIIALKRTTAIFSVVAGYFLFGEQKDFKTNMVSALILVLGVFLLLL